MTANTSINVTSLDFNSIKQGLKDFIKTKNEFIDYDFDGSTISFLLDILAYNTYQNSFYLNMAANESFLDSAQIRGNAVSIAKHLGYTPRSAKSAVATITVRFEPQDSPDQIVIPKYTKFQATKDGVAYYFVTLQEYAVTNNNGLYTKDIDIYEGYHVQQKFIDDKSSSFFRLTEPMIELNSVTVAVSPTDNSQISNSYTRVTDLTVVTATSRVFFVQENMDGYYEIYFGDGVLGVETVFGNSILIDYISCSGSEPNGIQVFKNTGYVGYNLANPTQKYTPSSIRTQIKAANGQDKESIESIKFNAPKDYARQKRLIIANDYKTYILNKYSYIDSIAVWGGDEHVPPIYGKVLLSIKPNGGYTISETRKDAIVADLSSMNPLTIEPVIIDPIFNFVVPTIAIKYDSSKTTLTVDQLYNKVQDKVAAFEDENLSIFGNDFRYSAFIRALDDADQSIISNDTDVRLEKRISPVLNSFITYKLRFDTSIKNPYSGYLGAVNSTGFKIAQNANTVYIDDDGKGAIRLYYLNELNNKVYINSNAGTVDYTNGIILLNSFKIISIEGDEIRVIVQTDSKDYFPLRNQILLFSNPNVTIYDAKKQQIVKTGILDVNGNISPLFSNSIEVPVTL